MCEHIIGLWHDFDDTRLMTLEMLKQHIEILNYGRICQDELKISDFLDRRKGTNLEHFKYCPLCGEKIDWEGMKENATKN